MLRVLALAVVCLALGTSALAAPTIDIKARTRIVVDDIGRTRSGVHVRGILLDSSTGAGVPGQDVVVRGEDRELRVTTGSSGRFDALVVLSPGPHNLAVMFGGNTGYDASSAEVRRLDVGKASLTLAVHAPAEIDATAASVEVSVEVTSPGGPESVPIILRAGDASGPAATRLVGEIHTDQDGAGKLVIVREKLGHPGDKRIIARFAGDDTFNEAEAETTFVIFTATQISDLKLPAGPVRFEDDVDVTGKLLDAQGNPVSGSLLSLVRADKREADAVTDDRGRFRLRVAAAELGPGPITFAVEFVSKTPWRRGTRSAPLTVEVLLARPPPVTLTALAFALTLVAVLAFALARTQKWRVILRWRRREAPAAMPKIDAPPAPGLVLSRPGLMSALRRAHDHVFAGRVIDLARGAPVVGARLVAGDLGVASGADGGFSLELPAGTWRVEVSAPGYLTCVVSVTAPHHGELRGARIDLLPVRERVFALYREVAGGLLPSPDLWGIWTPREILAHVRTRRASPAFADFTTFVEEICFSERVPDEGVVEAVRAGAGAARAELGH